EVPAGADAEEVCRPRRVLEFRAGVEPDEISACAANLPRCRSETFLRDQLARARDVASRNLAIEAEPHEAFRAQQRLKAVPGAEWIGEVMQNADRFDDVEVAPQSAELQDIGLRIGDTVDARFLRLALCVGEAREAEVDRQNICVLELQGGG